MLNKIKQRRDEEGRQWEEEIWMETLRGSEENKTTTRRIMREKQI